MSIEEIRTWLKFAFKTQNEELVDFILYQLHPGQVLTTVESVQ